MSAILYPIAASPADALDRPKGRAAREREAERLAGGEVAFVREFTGPVYRDEAQARAAWGSRIDGPGSGLAQEDRFCELKAVIQRSRVPFASPHTGWRLAVAYWRTGAAPTTKAEAEQARKARRQKAGVAPDVQALEAMANQPLLPLKPQKALDIGLFEVRLPENPDIVVPDE